MKIHPIIKELADRISHGDRSFVELQKDSRVSRGTLCRFAQLRLPFVSFDVVARTAKAFGYELRLVRRAK